MVDSRVRWTVSDESEAERRRLRASRSVVRRRSSTRYDGAVPRRRRVLVTRGDFFLHAVGVFSAYGVIFSAW